MASWVLTILPFINIMCNTHRMICIRGFIKVKICRKKTDYYLKKWMIILETQSCNENAIAFYKKTGFEIVGLDLYSYFNTDPERHEVRIEMRNLIL